MTATVVTSETAAEFYASKMSAPAPEPAEATPVVEPVEPAVPEGDHVDDADDEAKQGKPANPKIDKRFGELTKQREDARREAATDRAAREGLEARIRELEGKPVAKAAEVSDGKPMPSQFTDAFEYAEKLAEWAGENALKNRDKQVAADKATKDRDDVVTAWKGRQEVTQAELPDYAEVIAASDVQVSDQVRDAILESDIGPKILYHLASNPELAASIAAKSAPSAMREIGRLEALLSAPATAATAAKTATPSKAPAPIAPIRATKSVDSPIDSDGEFRGNFAEFKAARLAGKIK